MITYPPTKPSRGENTRPRPIFTIPSATKTPHPAWAIPAPATPAIRLWLPLTGIPNRLAANTQQAAAVTPPPTATRPSPPVRIAGSTTPFPTVLATAVPEIAPRKFMTAAITTAVNGDITRVETTVAIALAASLKPLESSKISAMKITRARKVTSVWSIIDVLCRVYPSWLQGLRSSQWRPLNQTPRNV